MDPAPVIRGVEVDCLHELREEVVDIFLLRVHPFIRFSELTADDVPALPIPTPGRPGACTVGAAAMITGIGGGIAGGVLA